MEDQGIEDMIRKAPNLDYSDRKHMRQYCKILDTINALEPEMMAKTDAQLRGYSKRFNEHLSAYSKNVDQAATPKERKIASREIEQEMEKMLPEAYAVAREAARRLYGEGKKPADGKFGRHYDVQVLGGIALHYGNVAEMCTGEGKTIAATLPAYLNALTGKGVHIATVNDYLSTRDAEWMAPLFNFLGLSVGAVHSPVKGKNAQEDTDAHAFIPGKGRVIVPRKIAYKCDVTYGTSHEFGFDYLKDNTAKTLDEKVQRGHNFAIVDEVDNILIDEARTPLILSGIQDVDQTDMRLIGLADSIASGIVEQQKVLLREKRIEYGRRLSELDQKKKLTRREKQRKAELEGMLAKLKDERFVEYNDEKDESPNFYRYDPKKKAISLDDAGFASIEDEFEEFGDYGVSDTYLIGLVNNALRAHVVMKENVDYVVEHDAEGIKRAVIVDQRTGRKHPSKRWGEGIHEAVEAKEKISIKGKSVKHAAVTLPFYFAKYRKKSGMTGTAKAAKKEFADAYGLGVVAIPTNKPIQRVDQDDVLYATKQEKFRAVADEIRAWHSIGRPVLVGTSSIADSEALAKILRASGIEKYAVLNAKKENAPLEAKIVAGAGQKGAITIATNMAGRGTDISLGDGVDRIGYGMVYNTETRKLEKVDDEKGEGGLVVLGAERHESRRVDNQLRGRAGRQGDPGTTRFHTSLDDHSYRFIPEKKKEALKWLLEREDTPSSKIIEYLTLPLTSLFALVTGGGDVLTKSIEYSQKQRTENNRAARKNIFRKDAVLDRQRNAVYSLRDDALSGEGLRGAMFSKLDGVIRRMESEAAKDAEMTIKQTRELIKASEPVTINPEFENWYRQRAYREDAFQGKGRAYADADRDIKKDMQFDPGLIFPYMRDFLLEKKINEKFLCNARVDLDAAVIGEFELSKKQVKSLCSHVQGAYLAAAGEIGRPFEMLERKRILETLDSKWISHLTSMEWLGRDIWTKAYAGKDTKLAFVKESAEMFGRFIDDVVEDAMVCMIDLADTKRMVDATRGQPAHSR